MKSEGFTRVSTGELERLLRAIHRRTLDFPITRSNLIACAFGDLESHLDLLIGMDETAAQRLIVAALAERRPRRAV